MPDLKRWEGISIFTCIAEMAVSIKKKLAMPMDRQKANTALQDKPENGVAF